MELLNCAKAEANLHGHQHDRAKTTPHSQWIQPNLDPENSRHSYMATSEARLTTTVFGICASVWRLSTGQQIHKEGIQQPSLCFLKETSTISWPRESQGSHFRKIKEHGVWLSLLSENNSLKLVGGIPHGGCMHKAAREQLPGSS